MRWEDEEPDISIVGGVSDESASSSAAARD